jgi:dihydroorotase
MDLVVEGNCYVSGSLVKCCVGIEKGKIVKIGKMLEGEKSYDFGDRLILPGAIDVHVHFRDPGMTDKEDFGTGSLAAIHGGVTCVFDMPNTRPHTTTTSALSEKKNIASSKSMTDFGLFAGVRPGIDVPALAKEAVGFKLYMGSTTGDLLVSDLSSIKKELSAISASGKVLAVHAEDENIRRKDIEKDLHDHLRNRPNECETSAIRKIVEATNGSRLHICHVSAKSSLPLLTNAQNLTSEVTPHHLMLDSTNHLGTLGKVNPPLRRREDRQAMFQALKSGGLDVIASDHAPHTMDDKEEEFEYAPTGMPGVETTLPLMLQLVKDGHLEIGGVVKRMCWRPGEIFGLKKGKIELGYDADLIVVDMMSDSIIKGEKLHSKCGWTAYEGMPAIFPKSVFLRGEMMVENGARSGERMGRDVVGTL